MTMQDLARRIVKLERAMAEMSHVGPRSGAWYIEHAGQFVNDPVYNQIARRGRAYRRSLRPATRGKKR